MSGGGGDDDAGHHGGAWKLAYADFVTAMMAFFILMWLLSSPKPSDVQGISDYFLKAPKDRAQDQVNSANEKADKPVVGPQFKDNPQGPGAAQLMEMAEKKITEEMAKQDAKKLEELKDKIAGLIDKDEKLREFKEQIQLETTEEGLKIDLFDDKNRAMFDSGRAALKPFTQEIIKSLARALNEVDSKLALTGHTDAVPFTNMSAAYTNWELSSDRAGALRRELVRSGVPQDKVLRVIGMGASVPLVDDVYAPINRRIEITVLSKKAEQDILKSELGSRVNAKR